MGLFSCLANAAPPAGPPHQPGRSGWLGSRPSRQYFLLHFVYILRNCCANLRMYLQRNVRPIHSHTLWSAICCTNRKSRYIPRDYTVPILFPGKPSLDIPARVRWFVFEGNVHLSTRRSAFYQAPDLRGKETSERAIFYQKSELSGPWVTHDRPWRTQNTGSCHNSNLGDGVFCCSREEQKH